MSTFTEIKDIALIAKEIREKIKGIEGAVYSVQINRQWSTLKRSKPINVIYVQGGVKLWGDKWYPGGEDLGYQQLDQVILDISQGYDLDIVGRGTQGYTLIQHL